MSKKTITVVKGRWIPTRQRILDTAYDLFTTQGTKSVGVDTISARSSVAKMTLYNHFSSKEALVLAFLDLREKRWTTDWLKAEVASRTENPRAGLLAIFDLYHEWFQTSEFQGCPFLKVLCEAPVGSIAHKATVHQLNKVRDFTTQLARKAKLSDPMSLGQVWMMLMEGAILSAHGGHPDAALKAKQAAIVLLEAWSKRAPPIRQRA